ncbi:MAG: hypothetical protein K1X88_32790 [Nannocystaceae bacterium]|nr:hypothetical protein [Nannocystaceae bacterium]
MERAFAPPLPLAEQRAASLAKLGKLDERPIARLAPMRTASRDGLELVPWPAQPLGRLRVVHRGATVLVVTDGLSDPWDPSLHHDVPNFRYWLELAIEAPATGDPAAPVPPWVAPLLWSASNWLVTQRFDLRARLKHHLCLTLGVMPVPGLEGWVSRAGVHGTLVGLPFSGETLGAHAVLARDAGDPVWILPIKLLHPAEYDWAMGVRDASRATWLVQAFLMNERHLSRLDRAPIITT